MKKLFWILCGVVIALVLLVLVAVLTLPFTINPIVKTAASVGGPKVLGVPVSVGNVTLSPLSGSLTISQLTVGNPRGYSDKSAFAVDKVDVELDLRSLLSDTIGVKKIQIDAPAISFEVKDGISNFDAILSHAKKAESEEKAKPSEEKKPGKKVIIDSFTLNSAKVSCTTAWTFGKPLTIPLPSVTVKDIGKSSGGATPVEAVTQVINEIVAGLSQAVSALAKQSEDVLKGALKGSGDATKGVTDALKGVTDGSTNAEKSAEDSVKAAAKSLKKLFK